MMLERVELVRVHLPLVRPFRTSFGTQTVKDILLVHVETDAAEGWGEAAAHPEPYYNEEFVDASMLVIERFAVPALLSAAELTAESVQSSLARIKGYPAAKAGLEMAILDAELSACGLRLADYLGGTRDNVDVGVSVGITQSVGALVDLVSSYVNDGYRRVKLKIEPGFDVEPVAAVRTAFPDLALQVDANAAYTLDDLDHLSLLDDFGLLMIEQPFAADDLGGHAILTRRLRTPICLDESIVSLRSAEQALAAQACTVINLKVGRLGGVLVCRALHDLCVERGVPVWCGGMLESGVGRAANVALASLPGFVYPADLSASDRYFHRDLTEPFVMTGSRLAVPRGPGLGVSVDQSALADLRAIRHDLEVNR
ncbi:MAG: o-succinylbenzoate synthase [Acidimicrobiales bacterium]